MRAVRVSGWARACRVVLSCLLVCALAACGVTRGGDDPGNRRFRMVIPNSPGGGYDITGRSAAQVMEEQELTGRWEITNVIGASGTVALQRLVNEEGADDVVMSMGLGVVGAALTNESDARTTDTTPIARLIEEPEGIVVPADSPFRTVGDFVRAWKADPGSITVGGGSDYGGPDHLFPMLLAEHLGIEPSSVRYITYDGGGPLTSALLGNKVDVGITGLAEFEEQIDTGALRALAVSGSKPLRDVDAPTLQQAGIDLQFSNWRGVLAPPGISDGNRRMFIQMLDEMRRSPQWRQVLKENGWVDAWQPGAEFGRFLAGEQKRVATTLKELGLL